MKVNLVFMLFFQLFFVCIFLIEFMNGLIKFVLFVVECYIVLGRIERIEVFKIELVVVFFDILCLISLFSIKGCYFVSVFCKFDYVLQGLSDISIGE